MENKKVPLKVGEVFKIANCNLEFRVGKVKPTKILSITTRFTENQLDKLDESYDSILECIEVKVGDKWNFVKTGDVIFPSILEEDLSTLLALVMRFIHGYIIPVFTKSEGLNS